VERNEVTSRSGQREVTIVVATRNRCDELLATLGRLRATAPASPVVVVDNGSTDRTSGAVAGAFPEVSLLQAGRNLAAAGRTVGARRATTPYVAFSDDDSWWAPGALDRAVAVLDACPRLGLVGARVLVGPENHLDPTSAAMASSPLPPEPGLPGPAVLGFLACGSVVRREAFLAVGGFNDVLAVGGEEELLAIDLAAAGWGLAYLDDVVAHHHPSPVRDTRDRRRRQAANGMLVAWLRRPGRVVVARTTAALLAADGASRRAVVDVVGALPTIVRERRVIDAALERRVRMLEGHPPSG
jgi:GT2 family glycosyltransferase